MIRKTLLTVLVGLLGYSDAVAQENDLSDLTFSSEWTQEGKKWGGRQYTTPPVIQAGATGSYLIYWDRDEDGSPDYASMHRYVIQDIRVSPDRARASAVIEPLPLEAYIDTNGDGIGEVHALFNGISNKPLLKNKSQYKYDEIKIEHPKIDTIDI